MANKPKDQKKTDADFEASNQIYEIAQAPLKEEIERLKKEMVTKIRQSQLIGVLKKIDLDRRFNDLIEIIVLYQMKKSRAYKEEGYTWVQVCEAAGRDWRTIDRILEDVSPVFDAFSVNLTDLLGLELSQIRQLGRLKSVKLTDFDKDDLTPEGVEAIIERHKQDHKKAIEEKDADLRTKDRLLQGKEDVIRKMEKESRRLELLAEKKELTPEQNAFLTKMEAMRVQFDGFYMTHVEPETIVELIPGDEKPITVRMKVAYLITLEYMASQLNMALGVATDLFGSPRMQDPHYDTLAALKIEKIGA